MHARCHIRNDRAGRGSACCLDAACLDRSASGTSFPAESSRQNVQPVTDLSRPQERITIACGSSSPAPYFTGETHTSLAAGMACLLMTVKSETAERGSRISGSNHACRQMSGTIGGASQRALRIIRIRRRIILRIWLYRCQVPADRSD